jgi:hypothetical protein
MSIDYCRDRAAAADADLYLLSLLAPKADQPGLWVRLALFDELARIGEAATDPTMRLIRLQWWRDEWAKLRAGLAPARHPVLEGMAMVMPAVTELDQLMDRVDDWLSRPVGAIETEFALHTAVVGAVLAWFDPGCPKPLVQAWAIITWVRAHPGDAARYSGIDQVTVMAARQAAPCRVTRGLCTLVILYAQRAVRAGYRADDARFLAPIPFKELRVWWGALSIGRRGV